MQSTENVNQQIISEQLLNHGIFLDKVALKSTPNRIKSLY